MKNYIKDNHDHYEVNIPINGIHKDNIDIEIKEHNLYIKAKRNIKIPEEYQLIHKEYEENKEIEYSFNIGKDIEADNIKANIKDSLLSIILTKKAPAINKKIEII